MCPYLPHATSVTTIIRTQNSCSGGRCGEAYCAEHAQARRVDRFVDADRAPGAARAVPDEVAVLALA
jgi:hypothetical protein